VRSPNAIEHPLDVPRQVNEVDQVTIPVDALKAAGLREGDRLKSSSPAPGIVVLELEVDPLDRLRGDLTGVYQPGDLDTLRDEWA
jgi:hypothetical protein